jgi:hypothetical protein
VIDTHVRLGSLSRPWLPNHFRDELLEMTRLVVKLKLEPEDHRQR